MTDTYYSAILEGFKKWAPFYDLFLLPFGGARRAIVRAVSPGPGEKVLDVCTGTGTVALELSRVGAQVTGIDLSEHMLRRARRKKGAESVRFLKMDACEMMFSPKEFDIVTVSFGLHEMPLPVMQQVLREVSRVAKRRFVVIDYKRPESRLLARLYKRLIGLYEGPFFMAFLDLNLADVTANEGFRLETRSTALLKTCQVLTFRIT
jgi:demethylmenaquinone methyltransferase/2-methoxy-6-polyprenyl-1,4-benzoquinol methylase